MHDEHGRPLRASLQRDEVARRLFGKPLSARKIGRYEIRGTVGKGAMGTVMHAHDEVLGRDVALKALLHPGPGGAARLLREAQALAQLEHPNVVKIYDAGEIEGELYMAMELLRGRSLRQWQEEPRPWREVVEVYLGAGRGLAAAHAAGLVHRDFKPANCFVDDEGVATVFDFGLVKGHRVETSPLEAAETQESSAPSGSMLSQSLTQTGTILGTIAYMAPEQLLGQPATAQSDQYAFCVSFHEALVGQRPYQGSTAASLLFAMQSGTLSPPPPLPSGFPAIPRWLRRALERGLQLNAGDRHAGMNALLAIIERGLRRRRRWWNIGVGTAAFMGVGALALRSASLEAPVTPCEVDSEVMAGVWDDERRAATKDAFEATGLPFAAASHDQVARVLDRWSEDFIDEQRRACEATRVTEVQSEAMLDRRTACFDRRRRQVGAIVDVLQQADAQVVGGTKRLLASLPALTSCADPGSFPLPDDPARVARIEQAQAELDRARAWLETRGTQRAERLVEAVRDDIEPLDHLPLTLDFQSLEGELRLETDDYDEAAEILLDVARRAGTHGLDERVATTRTRLAYELVGQWSQPRHEQWVLADANAAVGRVAEADDPRALQMLELQARADCSAADHEGALQRLRQLEQRVEQLGIVLPSDSLKLQIGNELADLGRFDEAQRVYRRGLEEAVESFGAGSPTAVTIEMAMGVLALERGDIEGARPWLEDRGSVFATAFGPHDASTARALFASAKLHMMEGDFERASGEVDEVLANFSKQLGHHELTGQALNAQGTLRYFQGDFTGALTSYRESLALQRSILDAQDEELGVLHSNIGETLLALERHNEAIESFDRALAILELTPDHPRLALPLKGRGLARLTTGAAAAAVDDLARALTVHEGSGGEPIEVAEVEFGLARALVEAETAGPRPRQLARAARKRFSDLDLVDRVEAIDQWLDASTNTRKGKYDDQ
ncbi:MAG: protein kinase [Myxococcota bacterium]